MTEKQKKMLIRILCSFVLLVAAAIVEKLLPDALPQWGWLLVFLAPYLLIGYDVLKEAVESIFHGQMLDEHFLMMRGDGGRVCAWASWKRPSRSCCFIRWASCSRATRWARSPQVHQRA